MKKIFAFLCLVLVCTFALCSCEGKSAYNIAVENGFVGTEEEWLESFKGDDGKSAYEIAVENGFVGTEEEWLESLKGEEGGTVIQDQDPQNPKGLEFYLLPDDTYAVSAGKAICLEEIVIPAMYKGKRVTCVGAPREVNEHFLEKYGEVGFSAMPYLKKITLPDTILYIGDGAFSWCYQLTKINIPPSVTNIGEHAFEGCVKLLEKENNIYYVDTWAVGCDSGITAITLRSDTVGIAEKAFADQSSLVNVYIPSGVKYIDYNAFHNSSSANTTITVESANDAYYSKNNCLYDRATNEIIFGRKTTSSDSTGRY